MEMLGPVAYEKWQPPFTMREHDIEHKGKKLVSLYQLFMQSTDEYEFATEHLGGLQHLKSLRKSKWFEEGYRNHRGYTNWLSDMQLRDNSLAKKTIMLATKDGNISAARKLEDMSAPSKETKRGAFVKAEAKKEAAKAIEDEDFLADAASRLNIVKIRD